MKQSKFLRGVAVYLALSILFEIVYPTAAMALTGGPAQPEMSSFEPVGTSDMVDLFSGDFNYNIPLLDVGGYPVNISYHSGISMDQEASWVGLGWNINAGAINRNMRGLPDDFKGEEVVKEYNVKPNRTFGANVGFGAAVAGFDAISLNFSLGAKYNNYTGLGFEQSANIAISSGSTGKGSLTGSLGLRSSADGLDISPSVSFSATVDKKDGVDTKVGASLGASFNSRAGLKALSLNTSISQSQEVNQRVDKDKNKIAGTGNNSINSAGTGCSISFANSTYVPSISMPMKNLAVNVNFQMGATVFSIDGTLNLSGYYAEQRLAEKKQNIPAYGYMYSEEASNLDKVLMDFNREKDGSFTKTTPNLPLTNFSYDLFSVSGQGVGGMFRPFRGDLGYVFDSRNTTTSDSYSLGLEIAVGNLAHSGGDVTINDVNTTSGKWVDNNKAAERLKFRKAVSGNAAYEPYFFKEVGEKNVDSNPDLYALIGQDKPVRIGLQNDGAYEVRAKNVFEVGTNPVPAGDVPMTINPEAYTYRTNRQKRNQLFSIVRKADYGVSAQNTTLNTSINSNAKPDHIAEITTTKPDGTRYVYGLPAYNTKQREVTFSMGGSADDGNGTVGYTANSDNTKNNSNGIDNYFSSTDLPAYAHSYVLTAVLSPDYVDLTGNGCSPDDYGTYTKFTYDDPLAGGSSNHIYNWRTPYTKNKANFNKGLETDPIDEQGNYIYGEKEIRMLQIIETKNYVAVFVKKNRADGFDVADENGGIGDNTTPLLKKISLYSMPDYKANIGNLNNATPIKEVHFTYDYSLCPGTLNNAANPANLPNSLWTSDPECESLTNAGGKLTLKSIYFTYGKSTKAKLNSYQFIYSNLNPSYGMKDYDRWGNYKPNYSSGATLSNAYYPYVEQGNQATADANAAAWTLSDIVLPSGGKIKVDYESDDYAYVQDRRAMQMFMVTAVSSSVTADPTTNSGNLSTSSSSASTSDYLFFKLQTPVPVGTPASQFYDDYIAGINDMYFKFLVTINNGGKEYIPGYAEGIKSYGYATNAAGQSGGNYLYGYVQVNSVKLDDNSSTWVNPITKAALQFARINTPRQAYNWGYEPDPDKVTMESIIKSMADAGLLKNLAQTFVGPNKCLFNGAPAYPYNYYAHDFTYGKSWMRLLNPNRKKLGGGVRVKKIRISDEWAAMDAASQTFSYGQEYTYTKDENGKVISSGVASYEPMVGGDENPFRLPIAFSQKFKMAPDYDFFQEEPFGESFFPSPGVGYSKVTVKNLQYTLPTELVKRHATGMVENEFYTARDFPVITSRTPVDPRAKKSSALMKLLNLKVTDFMTASQGFCVELNDMHGKPKFTKIYAEGQSEFISAVEYKYKTIGNKLDNTAVVIGKDGSIQNKQIGVDYDFVADMREQRTDVINAGLQVNLYGFVVGIIPVVIPPILPTFSSEETRFRSATTTKIINRFGLLDETIAYDLGSVVSTKNLSYDSETGDVILTKTKNDFNDEIYSYNFPAYLAYDRMGPGYKNVGTVLSNLVNGLTFAATGKITDPTNTLVPGDEIQLTGTLPIGKTRFWIMKNKSDNFLYAIDNTGTPVPFSGNYTLRIVRSGRRNQQSLSVGAFTSLVNPIDKNNDQINDAQLGTFDESYKILNANATKYSEVWRTFCECGISPGVPGNPYIKGVLGNWRTKRGYVFLADRTQTKYNGNSNIRKDGPYSFFRQFWTPNSGNDWNAPADLLAANPHWTWSSEITEYSPYGPELENMDALKRYSAAIFGYNNTLAMAVGSNTRYKQMGFDNFEDYDFDDCPQDHFSFEPFVGANGIIISNTESHSGKRSIKVPAGGSVELTKTIDSCFVGGSGRD